MTTLAISSWGRSDSAKLLWRSRDESNSSRDRHSNFTESLLPQDEIAQVVKDAGCNVIIETAEPGVEDDIKFLLKQVG